MTAKVERLDVHAVTVPTDAPEQDGTFDWDSTTIVIVEARAGGETGLGYTYGDVSTGAFVESLLEPAVRGADPLRIALDHGLRHLLRLQLRDVRR